jgi:hypothetical protein
LTGTPPLVLTFEAEKTALPERVMRSAILERYARPGPGATARHVAASDQQYGGHHPPQTQRIRINTGRARSPVPR